SAANYCMAIRGNGEIEPAHWGAVANVVERLGLPQAQAGGSSATITMFLVDAIATNSFVRDMEGAASSARASLLLKSMQGFLTELTATNQWRDFMALLKRSQELKNPKWSHDMSAIFDYASKLDVESAQQVIAENKELLTSNYATGVKLGLISQKNYSPLFEAVQRLTAGKQDAEAFANDLKTAKFYAAELYSALTVFGSFNAQTDDNIFFRPGVVDFDRLANQFGRIGDFYSLMNPAPEEMSQWQKFFSVCTKPSAGKSWDELVAAEPECQTILSQMMSLHFAEGRGGNFAQNNIGLTIPSFPATAVLTGTAHEDAQKAQADNAEKMDSHFGKTFALRNSEDLRYGYWGRENLLALIDAKRDRSDEKSRRFMSLGPALWSKALGLSPAEPGLSPFKTFESNGVAMTSAGGWPDLHPVLLLRAAGCENIVYITRRGGESLFGQGIAKRLLGYSRDWSLISTSSPEAKKASAKLNNNGDPTDMKSMWARLYNLANPHSSMKRALKNADAILCTSWDNFEIKNGVGDMIADSYKSPFYVSPTGGLTGENLSPVLNPAEMNVDGGYPTFAGCF
ncbi:MAG: hypothetical protein ACXVA9_13390, partial [Bdellovibrionales bacterium]